MADATTSNTETSSAPSTITITVKSQKERESFKVLPTDDVKTLRDKVAQKFNVDPAAVCLIFSGKILRDGGAINSHHLEDGHIVHMVIRDAKSTAAASSTTNTASSTSAGSEPTGGSNTTSDSTRNTSTPAGSGGMFDLFNSMMGNNLFGGVTGDGNATGAAGGMPNSDFFNQMLNNPMIEQMTSNPELIQNIISNTPGFRELMDRNPELGQMLRSPELFRQSLDLMRNPAAMQEMMRNRDRAMSNLESMPGGFNALRRMYTEMEEPMFQALSSRSPFESTNNGNNPSANSTPNTTENRDPLPNPWDRSANTASSGAAGAGGNGTNNASAFPRSNTPFDPSALLGGSGGLSQMMRQLTSNPETMRNIMSSMGGMGANLPNMDQLSSQMGLMQRIMGNPEAFQALMDIQNAHARLERALGVSMFDLMSGNLNSTGPASGTTTTATNTTAGQQDSGANTGSGSTPGGNTTTTGSTTSGGSLPNANMFQNMGQLMNMLSAFGGNGQGLGATGAQSQQPPEERYASQLQQLESMGFNNRERNIRALVQSFGNVEAAIEIILSAP